MNAIKKIILLSVYMLFISCGDSNNDKKEKFNIKRKKSLPTVNKEKKKDLKLAILPSKTIDLINKGVGPIKNISLSKEIDMEMVNNGKQIFNKLCTACHKIGKKFIGPSPNKILDRRTPEWVMNMILNPDKMVKKDPLAKQLLIEFNGSPMANQNLDKDQARAILEYFRTLK